MYLIEYWGEKQEQTFHSVPELSLMRTSLHNHLPLSVFMEKKHVVGLNTGECNWPSILRKEISTKYLPWFWLLCYGIYLVHLLHAQGFPAVVCTKLVYCTCFCFCTVLFFLSSYQAMQYQSPCSVSATTPIDKSPTCN